MITKQSYLKRHLIAILAIPLLLGIAFAAILPTTGFTGIIVADDDESDDRHHAEGGCEEKLYRVYIIPHVFVKLR